MNKYYIKLLTTDKDLEDYYTKIEDINSGYTLTLTEFINWLEEMTDRFDYSEDYFHFIPVDEGSEMYRKGNELTKVTKHEFNSALLTITMFQGD